MIAVILAVLLAYLPACPGEDSPGPCGWDARHHGTGTGHSSVHIGQLTWTLP
jgi:hypothetical protein